MEPGESTRQAAAREFHEETSLVDWSFRDGFEQTLSYTYIRRGRKVVKTVTYYRRRGSRPDAPGLFSGTRDDPFGHWYRWGSFEEISLLLYHTKIRQVFAEADTWLKGKNDDSDVAPTVIPGLLLVLDGPDGGGKTTQAGSAGGMAAWSWARRGHLPRSRGTALGERLREILLDRSTRSTSRCGRRCCSTWPAGRSSSRK